MSKISKECKENIAGINQLVNKAIKEIKIANARAESAEKMLILVRNNAQKELNSAFDEGYRKGIEDANAGGESKSKDDTKLVLKSKN